MLPIYLPVAKVSVSLGPVFILGLLNGLFLGVFGVSGAFFAIPTMVRLGIPTPIAIVTGTVQVISASVMGFIINWRKNNIDFTIGSLISAGLLSGAVVGSYIFRALDSRGLLNITIPSIYVFVFGVMGLFMFSEGVQASYRKRYRITAPVKKSKKFSIGLGFMPFQMHFRKSNINISFILPILLGLVASILLTVAGVSTSMFILPIMIYVFRIPTMLSVGTSYYTSVVVSVVITIFQSVGMHNVDIVLGLIMTFGGIVGSRIGAKLGARMPPEELRAMLGVIMLVTVGTLLFGLFRRPSVLYAVFNL